MSNDKYEKLSIFQQYEFLAISKTSISIWRQIKARWTYEPWKHASLHSREYPYGEQLPTAPFFGCKWYQEIHDTLKWQLEWIWQSKDKGWSDGWYPPNSNRGEFALNFVLYIKKLKKNVFSLKYGIHIIKLEGLKRIIYAVAREWI